MIEANPTLVERHLSFPPGLCAIPAIGMFGNLLHGASAAEQVLTPAPLFL
jgi:hypothetical protein